jgi:protein-S-isoprenylcysteine O-methyltransferase Ste14
VTNVDWVRAGAIYLPLVLSIIAGMLHGKQPRLFAACLLSILWTAPALLMVQQLNSLAGWWSFTMSPGVRLTGISPELYCGWLILWGILPPLVFRRLPVPWCVAIMVALDLMAMPLCKPVVTLNSSWLIGEAVAAAFVLFPALCIARWTLNGSHLYTRSVIQVAISALVFLYFVPELTFFFQPAGWWQLTQMPGWERQIGLQIVLLLALPGLGAVMEFAQRGGGTPIPYDPPVRLVTSGVYRYIANPMQISCTLVMISWAWLLHHLLLMVAAGVAVIYSVGVATWDESQDLRRRFGEDWRAYRKEVRNWIPRWKPFHSGEPARLYIAATCGPCSELRRWIEARNPLGLALIDAENLPSGSVRRLRYDPGDGCEAVEGVRAFGRALEHLHLGWTMVGIALRLPLVWQFVQMVMDASGLGPRRLADISS